MLIKIRFVDKLCACVELHRREAGAQPYVLHFNTRTATTPPTVNTHKHTPGHARTDAGCWFRTNGITSVCCVSVYVFRCVLVEPAVTSLQDTTGHKSRWHPGAIFAEYFIWPPGVLNGTKKFRAKSFSSKHPFTKLLWANFYFLYYLLLSQMCQKSFWECWVSFFSFKKFIYALIGI